MGQLLADEGLEWAETVAPKRYVHILFLAARNLLWFRKRVSVDVIKLKIPR